MSTPPKATPTTPRWAITAAREITRDSFSHYYGGIAANYESEREAVSLAFATIIAKHAPPPAAQPSDVAGLREKLRALCSSARDTAVCLVDAQKGPNNVMRVEGPQRLKDKLNEIMELLPHAAPHLSQREPGDSDGEVLRGKLMSAGDLTLLEDQNAIEETGVFVKCTREALRALNGNLVYEEVEIRKSAQRGEGKP